MTLRAGCRSLCCLLVLGLLLAPAWAQDDETPTSASARTPSVDDLIHSAQSTDDDLPSDFAALSELRSALQRGIPAIDIELEERQAALNAVRGMMNERRQLEIELEDVQIYLAEAEEDVTDIEARIEAARQRLETARTQLDDPTLTASQRDELQTTIQTIDGTLQSLDFDLEWAMDDADYYAFRVDSIPDEIADVDARIAEYGTFEEIRQQIDGLRAQRINYERTQVDVDLAITRLLMPEVEAQRFKTYVSIIFAALVGFVIFGFFYIAAKDTDVRRTIFSGDTGIQFITLFAIIIAIILFGITGILGDKELAAILAAIAGYILGRTQQSVRRQPEADEPEPAA